MKQFRIKKGVLSWAEYYNSNSYNNKIDLTSDHIRQTKEYMEKNLWDGKAGSGDYRGQRFFVSFMEEVCNLDITSQPDEYGIHMSIIEWFKIHMRDKLANFRKHYLATGRIIKTDGGKNYFVPAIEYHTSQLKAALSVLSCKQIAVATSEAMEKSRITGLIQALQKRKTISQNDATYDIKEEHESCHDMHGGQYAMQNTAPKRASAHRSKSRSKERREDAMAARSSDRLHSRSKKKSRKEKATPHGSGRKRFQGLHKKQLESSS
ncbi:hypothetical protein BJ508DRAFT_303274 [Ascobolus immersus RN42]|uniref:Uncharacterized protein n=1 Tax=Ascobolus immersus RN42 TaxID=1160509 RepID=A0A3N4ITD0_ASCIM|nr:hypothetical protein BJ508DRAFT_303274 [Ascobolus immersus RN42]